MFANKLSVALYRHLSYTRTRSATDGVAHKSEGSSHRVRHSMPDSRKQPRIKTMFSSLRESETRCDPFEFFLVLQYTSGIFVQLKVVGRAAMDLTHTYWLCQWRERYCLGRWKEDNSTEAMYP